MTFEIGVAEKESSTNLPFVEIGRRGNVRAEGDLKKRRSYFVPHKFDWVLTLRKRPVLSAPRSNPLPFHIAGFHRHAIKNKSLKRFVD